MDDILLKYLSEKIISDIREGENFPDLFFDAIFRSGCKDRLRQLVTKEDIPIIKKLLDSDYKNKIVLGHVLCRKLLPMPEIRSLLEERWEKENNPDVKIAIIYDLAEYIDIPDALKNAMFAYIKSNRKTYEAHILDWYGGPDKILSPVKNKLDNPKLFHKRWIYILNLSVSSEKDKAHALLDHYLQSKDLDTFTRKVTRYSIAFINGN